MDDIEQKREAIMKTYDSDSWRERVKDMSDIQIIAIYLRFRGEGKL